MSSAKKRRERNRKRLCDEVREARSLIERGMDMARWVHIDEYRNRMIDNAALGMLNAGFVVKYSNKS